MTRRFAIRLGAFLLGGASLMAAAAQTMPFDRPLDNKLAPLVQLAENHPESALQALKKLRAELQPSPSQTWQFDYAQAQMLIAAGDAQAGAALAEQLAGAQTAFAPQLLLLRAQVAILNAQDDQAGQLAQQSLQGLEKACVRTALADSIQTQGCDFRSAWHALRLLASAQLNRGEIAFAEASASFALDLARAGQDRYLTVLSLGDMAAIQQTLDRPEEAQRLLTQELQAAQGDTLLLANAKLDEAFLAATRNERVLQQQVLELALQLAKQADAPRDVALIQANLADAYMHLGQAAKAAEAAKQALPTVLQFKDRRTERTLRHNLSVALVLLRQFDAARREIELVAQLNERRKAGAQRIAQLRELGHAYAETGQIPEALRLYHQERQLSADLATSSREASLQHLRLKYDSEAKQRDLELLERAGAVQDQQLMNRNRAQQVGMALATLLGLSALLVAWMLLRVRESNRKLKAKQALLRAQSERDPLTDLANRRHFLGVMEQQDADNFEGALLMIDIDHFKHVNDQHGHGAGDLVICEVAKRISHAVRTEDLVVRWGGEEFLVFAPGVALEQLPQLAERILFGVGAEAVAIEGGSLQVSVSIGYAHFPLPPSKLRLHWEQAVNWADMALYTAKAQGRNRAVGIVTVLAQDSDALLQIEADFDAACSSERVSLQQVLGPPRWQNSTQHSQFS